MTDEIKKLKRITKLLRNSGVKYYSTQELTLELFDTAPAEEQKAVPASTTQLQMKAYPQLNPEIDEVDAMIASMASVR